MYGIVHSLIMAAHNERCGCYVTGNISSDSPPHLSLCRTSDSKLSMPGRAELFNLGVPSLPGGSALARVVQKP